jgi:DNA-binding transcriptional ArsR family regulator
VPRSSRSDRHRSERSIALRRLAEESHGQRGPPRLPAYAHTHLLIYAHSRRVFILQLEGPCACELSVCESGRPSVLPRFIWHSWQQLAGRETPRQQDRHMHDSLELPQPTVSRHLAYLRRAGLVDVRRDGVWMHYQVARSLDPTVQTVLNAAAEALTNVRTTAEDRKQFQRAFGQLYVMNTPTGGACCAPRA